MRPFSCVADARTGSGNLTLASCRYSERYVEAASTLPAASEDSTSRNRLQLPDYTIGASTAYRIGPLTRS